MATVLEKNTTEEQRSVVHFLAKRVNAKDIHKYFLFTVEVFVVA
jgi:hypothetical protein